MRFSAVGAATPLALPLVQSTISVSLLAAKTACHNLSPTSMLDGFNLALAVTHGDQSILAIGSHAANHRLALLDRTASGKINTRVWSLGAFATGHHRRR